MIETLDRFSLGKLQEYDSVPPAVENAIRASYGHRGAWESFVTTHTVEEQLERAVAVTRDFRSRSASALHGIEIIRMVAESVAAVQKGEVEYATELTAHAASLISTGQRERQVIQDLEILSVAFRAGKFTQFIPEDFFATHSIFDLSERSEVIEVSSAVNALLIEQLAAEPRLLYSLDPRRFEEVIAELFSGFGFDVELTSATRDGGYDIVAVRHQPLAMQCLIECKRYAEYNKVGVVPVRSLHGVLMHNQSNKGILATTSSFTGPAREYIDQHQWLLEGRDYKGIVAWLRAYQRHRLGYSGLTNRSTGAAVERGRRNERRWPPPG